MFIWFLYSVKVAGDLIIIIHTPSPTYKTPHGRPGAAADKAAANKSSKYCDLAGTHLFFSVVIETAGTWNQMAVELVQEIGRRITLVTEDSTETVFCSSACPLPFNGEMRSPSSARSLPPINHPLQSFLA